MELVTGGAHSTRDDERTFAVEFWGEIVLKAKSEKRMAAHRHAKVVNFFMLVRLLLSVG